MFKFLSGLFKKKKIVPVKKKVLSLSSEQEERLDDLESVVAVQAQIISNLIDRLDQVKQFRDTYVDDLRVVCNAISNLDKRTHDVEELIQHINYEIAEIEQNIANQDSDESIYTSVKPKSDLN